jgi:hypothetical protein
MQQSQLNEYFSTKWKSNVDQYLYTGWSLIDKVKEDEWVLDVGCGHNPFKSKIKNLIGIDPAFDESDHKVTIEDFKFPQKFDVAFCLGSINFGSKDTIIKQISSVVNHLQPNCRIYWRCNPGLKDHGNLECEDINFFPWSYDLHFEFCDLFGFECTELKYDVNNRIYAAWEKQS